MRVEKRVKNRFIWCSSPDRGLEELLNLWPILKKELPDAELKIYYGWEYFNSSLHIPYQREFKERIRALIKQSGVEWCGRVGQSQLPHELAKAEGMIFNREVGIEKVMKGLTSLKELNKVTFVE